ncbi:hypothetical protein ACPW96_17115 [Micromonospora sp. DT81.3]|uniref:hypothetical protein n=1 Tax=Micromonospora sp. DT81.3 TaxID=3416523 RepID=UPI003CFAE7F1
MAIDRREARAAKRADLSGSGPTLHERPPARFPGATARFALLGEVLLIGLLVTLVSLPLVTFPAALAAGIRHLRRYIAAEASPLFAFWRDLRAALAGGLVVGVIALVLTAILLLDVDLADSGLLPGGAAIAIFGWVGLAAVGVSLLAAAGAWSPEPHKGRASASRGFGAEPQTGRASASRGSGAEPHIGRASASRGSGAEPHIGRASASRGFGAEPHKGWRGAVRSVPRTLRGDIPGTLYFAATAVFVVVLTWALPPLIIPALGCAALAAVAIPARARRTRA